MPTYELAKDISDSDWLCLHRNENLFVSHDWASGLITGHLQEGALFTAYPDSLCLRLREGLADQFSVQPANMYVGNGADGVLADLLTVLRREYDSLSILDIGFRVYHLLANRFDYAVHIINGNTFYTRHVFSDATP